VNQFDYPLVLHAVGNLVSAAGRRATSSP